MSCTVVGPPVRLGMLSNLLVLLAGRRDVVRWVPTFVSEWLLHVIDSVRGALGSLTHSLERVCPPLRTLGTEQSTTLMLRACNSHIPGYGIVTNSMNAEICCFRAGGGSGG